MTLEEVKTQIKLKSFQYETEAGLVKEPTVKLTDVLNLLDGLSSLPAVDRSLPTKEQIASKVEEYAFRVPYDGSNNFYDDQAIKHFTAGINWYKQQIEVER